MNDPERLARFQREAKVLASLNHPNIAAIYGLEEAGDSPALVLEYVEGPTLQDRIAQGPISLDEALPIAKQIAEALEAAHEAGVIHRDLKPANVKVKSDGMVKVLDFGLAKALGPESGGDPSQSPTMTAAATKMGVIMGTAAYMSPEQARGQAADKRADIWAFGCVLLEMLTGRQAFAGTLMSDVFAAIIRAEPDWDGFPTRVHPGLRALLERCLQKDPRARWRDIGDVRVDLEKIAGDPTGAELSTVAVHAHPTEHRWVPWAVAGVLAVGIVWLLVPSASAPTRDPTPAAVEVVLPDGVHLAVDTRHPTIALFPWCLFVEVSAASSCPPVPVPRAELIDRVLINVDEPQSSSVLGGPIPSRWLKRGPLDRRGNPQHDLIVRQSQADALIQSQ